MSGLTATMRRPTEGRLLLGVCAALAKRFEVDPLLVRIATGIALLVLTTPVVVAYAGLALVVPREDGRMLFGSPPDRRETLIGAGIVFAASALVIATPSVLLGDRFGAFELGMLLIAAALIGLAAGRGDAGERPASQAVEAAPVTPDPAGGAPPVATAGAPAADAPTAVADVPPGSGEEPTEPQLQTKDQAAARPEKPAKGPSLFGPMVAVIIGLFGLGSVVVSVFDIGLTPVAVALIFGSLAVMCGGVAIASVDRRGLVPLLILGVLFAVIAAGAAIGRDEFERGIGYRDYRAVSEAELEKGYEIGMGFVEIDVRDVDLPPGETVMPLHVGFGAAEVTVPANLQVVSTGEHLNGEVTPVDRDRPAQDERPKAPEPPPPVLVLDADVTAGAVELRRTGDGD